MKKSNHLQSFPKNKPKQPGRCLVEYLSQNDLGENIFFWFAFWDGENFKDYAGCDDIREGTRVLSFIEEDDLFNLLEFGKEGEAN